MDATFTPRVGNKSAIGNEYLYTGRRLDPETGLQLNRRRFYASHLGRFINRDPIEYLAGTNLFQYVKGDPLSNYDPTGLAPSFWDGLACAALATAASLAFGTALASCTACLIPDPAEPVEAGVCAASVGAFILAAIGAKQACIDNPAQIKKIEDMERKLNELYDEIFGEKKCCPK